MTLEQIKKIPATEIAELDKLAEKIIKGEMTTRQEQYIIKWFLPNGVWTTGIVSATYNKALKAIDGFKRFDEKEGRKYKYRIIKQTIQEEVVYNEL